MNQPKWKMVANLGDATPLDYGGAFVFVDETGVYPPEMVYWDDQSNYPEETPITVYRFSMDKCTFIDAVLSDNEFNPDHPAWFADSLDDVSRTSSVPVSDLSAWLCSDDAIDRGRAYLEILGHHGVENFDRYPNTYDREELADSIRRWKKTMECV